MTTVPFPAAGAEQATLDALEAACGAGAAAFIVEPLILGSGGMLIYPPHLLAEMAAICARHNVLFIADEVMTAWGRTGTLLACNQAGVVPDILCLSKGLTGGAVPLAVTMAREEIFMAHWSGDRADCFFHSSSYTANPIACAAATENLAIWRDEPVQQRIDSLVAMQARALAAICDHPLVTSTRQCGTIAAFDLQTDAGGYLSNWAVHLNRFGKARGVLIRPLGNTVYVMPPYCITQEQLTHVYAVVRDGLDART